MLRYRLVIGTPPILTQRPGVKLHRQGAHLPLAVPVGIVGQWVELRIGEQVRRHEFLQLVAQLRDLTTQVAHLLVGVRQIALGQFARVRLALKRVLQLPDLLRG